MSERTLSISEVAQLLNVSCATVRNWQRVDLLPKRVTQLHVDLLKQRLEDGSVTRLRSRANKQASQHSFIPTEYLDNPSLINAIDAVVKSAHRFFGENIKVALCNSVLNFLPEKEFDFNSFTFKRRAIALTFESYLMGEEMSVNLDFQKDTFSDFAALRAAGTQDLLGTIYQSLQIEGVKSRNGSYYSPRVVVDKLVSQLSPGMRSFLDPCCGTGAFLLSVQKHHALKMDQIFGADQDEHAVFIARINLLLQSDEQDLVPQIYLLDSLKELGTSVLKQLLNRVDAVATNPPWGASKNCGDYLEYKKKVGSNELFSMFIVKALEFVKEGGESAFILPESILNIQRHQGVRSFILKEASLLKIEEFGPLFSGVFSPVISLSLRKEPADSRHKVAVSSAGNVYTILQSSFLNTDSNAFEIHVDPSVSKILEKVFSTPHQTLKNRAKWALGVVTGDNQFFISTTETAKRVPVVRGKDISPFTVQHPVHYLLYDRNKLQQVAKEELYYSPEKLVYKFISNRLVFAYDNQQFLTLNSANCVIPDLEQMSVKVVLAFLNSELFQFIFKQKFATHKVLRRHLEQLPFPLITTSQHKKIQHYVEQILAGQTDATDSLNALVYKLFGLTKQQQQRIKSYL